MKKHSKIFALLLAAALLLSLLAACGPSIDVGGDPTNNPGQNTSNPNNPGSTNDPGTPAAKLEFAAGTELRMAVGYNSAKTGMFFDSETAGDGVKLADGNTYRTGDLKPTWVEVQNRLGMKFIDKYQGNSATNEWNYWKDQLDQVDMISGTATLLNENGVAGSLVNIAEYLDMMPNFKAYLEANPIVRLSITGDTDTGAIYFSPYFDGVDDIERMPLMRTDWVEKLLNGPGAFTAGNSNKTSAPVYQPYMPTSGSYPIESVSSDGKSVATITKNYDAYGNIIAKMNEKGSMSGVDAVNMLRDYIDATYGGYYGENRANLFIGQDACWDADELVALLRCVVANPQTLNGTNSVQGLFSRQDNNMQRKVDLFRFAGSLFGVRGLESRQDYLYVGNDGLLHDARQEVDTYVALERMNALVKEGLISEDYIRNGDGETKKYLENDLGFMHYDYSQTQTIFNDQGVLDDGEEYRPVMVPVARWNDGTGEQFFRFTESWRSVKTDGWGISKAGVGNDQDKLYACLALIDFAYSREGQVLLSYGPSTWVSSTTFNFNGEQWPEISEAARTELWSLPGINGNYTNYARYYLGSTLSFLKSQAFEYQCTVEAGRKGAGYISNAIGLGVIKHPELGIASNQWYTSVPTTLPTDKQQNDQINSYTDLTQQFGSSSNSINILVELIIDGYGGADVPSGVSSAQALADYVSNNYNGKAYLAIKNDAWDLDLDYYDSIK